MPPFQEDKTTIRTNKDETTTVKVSVSKFPEDVHQKVLDRSSRDNTVYDIYSDAVSRLRQDYDNGDCITLVDPPRTGKRNQVWLTEQANNDMRYLEVRLNGKHASVCYTAVLRYLEREKERVW